MFKYLQKCVKNWHLLIGLPELNYNFPESCRIYFKQSDIGFQAFNFLFKNTLIGPFFYPKMKYFLGNLFFVFWVKIKILHIIEIEINLQTVFYIKIKN